MEEEKKKAAALVKEAGHQLIYMTECQQNSISVAKSPSIIVITDYNLYFYNPRTEKISGTYPWLQIKYYNPQSNQIDIKFNIRFSISSKNLQEIIENIDHCLEQILSPLELAGLNSEHFLNPKFSKCGPAAIIRFIEYCNMNKITISPKNIDILREFLARQTKIIDSSNFSDPLHSIGPLMYATEICPWVNKVSIHEYGKTDIFKFLIGIGELLLKFQHIEISTRQSGSLRKFSQTFSQLHPSKLSGITFSGFPLSDDDISAIYDIYATLKIPSLKLKDTSLPESFERNFFKLNLSSSLKFLSFDNIQNIDLSFLRSAKNICALSVENCGLEVYDVLAAIDSASLTELKVLNVSKNKATLMPYAGFSLPPSLFSFAANSVIWLDNTLRNILAKILKQDSVKKISFATAHCSKTEWKSVLTLFEKSNRTNIISFTWNDNEINESLFNFLANNTELQFLALSGCLHERQSRVALHALHYLEKKPQSLASLILRSSSKRYLGRLLRSFVVAAAACPSLTHLDVSNSKSGDEGAIFLTKLFKAKTRIREIVVDGLSPVTLPSLEELATAASNSEIRLAFMRKDVEELLAENRIRKEDAEKCRVPLLTRPKTHAKDSVLTKPFFIYESEYDQSFPSFMTREECEALSRIGQEIKVEEAPIEDNKENNEEEQEEEEEKAASMAYSVVREIKERKIDTQRPEPLIVPHLETNSVEQELSARNKEVEPPKPPTLEGERRNIIGKKVTAPSVKELPVEDVLSDFTGKPF